MWLNPASYPGLLRLLRTSHRVVSEVYILDNNRNYLRNATDALIEGSVDMDSDAAISRSCKMTLLDPGNRLGIDPNGGTSGPEFYNRMVQIVYRVTSMDYSETYGVPIFTGPVTDSSRDGVVLTVEGKGLEILAQDGLLNDYTWPAGWARSAVIMNAIQVVTGERFFSDASGGGYFLRSPWSVQSGANLWAELKYLGDSMGMAVYFDGQGFLKIRPKIVAPLMTIDATWMTEDPDAAFDMSKIRNVCRVEGASYPTADGTQVKMKYEAWPPPQHPFSPQSLARWGTNRVIPRFVTDDSLADWSSLAETADQNLYYDLMYSTEVTAVTSVIPFLEEFDVVTISHPRLYLDTPVSKWTIPLVGDAEMSLNFFSSSSRGVTSGGAVVSNANLWGRLNSPGVKHGPSGAYNGLATLGTKGENWYGGKDGGAPKPNKGKKGKKGNRNRGGGKGKKKR